MNTERRIDRTLLIDADDTLWECNIFYASCTNSFCEHMLSLGFDEHRARSLQKKAEIDVIPEYGYSPTGYVRSLEMTYEQLALEAGQTSHPSELARIADYADMVLNPRMILMGHVNETLQALGARNKLVLVTKGDQEFQQRKLDASGLEPLFDATYIVSEKHENIYRRVASEQALEWSHTWMIGNSPKSDINPAVRAGLGAIYIPHPASWSAELEPIECPEQVITLARFSDLLDYFQVQSCEYQPS